jgi:hypothetical protein
MTRLGQGDDLRTRDRCTASVANERRIAITTRRTRTFLWLSRLDSPRSIHS